MSRIHILFTASVALLPCLGESIAMAQNDLTQQGMGLVPQRAYINPAYMPQTKVFIGLPMLSSNRVAVGSTGFAYSSLFRTNNEDSLYVDLSNMVEGLGSSSLVSINAGIDLLALSVQFGKNNLMFNMTEKIVGRARLPQDLMRFVHKGNGAYLGQTADFSSLNFSASHYREYGLTYARMLLDGKLNLGISVKYLYGMENISTENRGISLFTDAQTYDITARSEFTVNSSGFFGDQGLGSIPDDVGGYLFSRNNHGFAFNLGATYQLNPKWSIAASVVDLGSITWAHAPENQIMDGKGFTFRGIDLGEFMSVSDSSDYLANVLDSMVQTFGLEERNEKYSTTLPARFYLSGTYRINDKMNAALHFNGEFYKGHFDPAIGLTYNLSLGRVFGLGISYAYANGSFANLGAGFSLTVGPLQWYFNLDNVLAPIIPQHVQGAHFHSGLNIIIGKRQQSTTRTDKDADSDHDGVSDRHDRCPDQEGPSGTDGCPDTDIDGTPNIDDKCPFDPGPKDNNGCPK